MGNKEIKSLCVSVNGDLKCGKGVHGMIVHIYCHYLYEREEVAEEEKFVEEKWPTPIRPVMQMKAQYEDRDRRWTNKNNHWDTENSQNGTDQSIA